MRTTIKRTVEVEDIAFRALGNAVVPQQAFVIFQEIARIERGRFYGAEAMTSQILEHAGESAGFTPHEWRTV